MGDWFGGYALFVVDGRAHFTFARAADALALAMTAVMEPGRRSIAVSYRVRPRWRTGRDGAVGRRAGSPRPSRWRECCRSPSSTAGRACGWGSTAAFPVSPRYRPPAVFSGTVHFVRIEALGGAVPDPGRGGAHRAPRRLSPRRRLTACVMGCAVPSRVAFIAVAHTGQRAQLLDAASEPAPGPVGGGLQRQHHETGC